MEPTGSVLPGATAPAGCELSGVGTGALLAAGAGAVGVEACEKILPMMVENMLIVFGG